ncbi:BED-type domain-containing protein [Aphis craccivora]|uniref:BED-type domain-containing protein n=1 Tax=Aphis craccivora TaxID=307492 RepID=A0A6G0YF75_APHCR|nr:BED-type domain-containing protein [Aphis craccivora]
MDQQKLCEDEPDELDVADTPNEACNSPYDGKNIGAQCQYCPKIIHGQKGSTGNFLSHIKLNHSSLQEKVKANKLTNCNASSYATNKREKLSFSRVTNISKQKITELVFNHIVEEMRPLITTEKPAFQKLILGIAGLTQSDHALLPDRRTMSKELKLRYSNYVSMLTSLIEKHTYVCTTADIWSSNNKSYLRSTCHFINEETFERHSYVLGCRRIKGGHNFLNIAEVINETHQSFQISNTKISHIVTVNASNFAKAFRSFSNTSSSYNKCDSYNVGNFSDDSECSDTNYVNSEDSYSIEVEYLDSDV